MVERLDDPLAIALEEAVRVDVSPEFVARVRQQLARESIGKRSALATWTPALAAAASVGLILIALWNPAGPPQKTTLTARALALPQSTVTAAMAVPGRLDDPPRIAQRAATVSVADGTGDEVLIPQAELEAVRTFIAAAQRGAFDYELAPNAVPVAEENSPVADIVIAPITLLPLLGTDSLE